MGQDDIEIPRTMGAVLMSSAQPPRNQLPIFDRWIVAAIACLSIGALFKVAVNDRYSQLDAAIAQFSLPSGATIYGNASQLRSVLQRVEPQEPTVARPPLDGSANQAIASISLQQVLDQTLTAESEQVSETSLADAALYDWMLEHLDAEAVILNDDADFTLEEPSEQHLAAQSLNATPEQDQE